jgi:hypothetical protein
LKASHHVGALIETMPRRKIETNTIAFSRLYAIDRSSAAASSPETQARWIKTSPEERLWLENAEFIAVEAISSRLKFATIGYGGKHYLVVLGASSPPPFSENLVPFSVNAGLATAIIAELSPPFKVGATWLDVEQSILPLKRGDAGYDGHDVNDVLALFEPVLLYEIDSNAPFNSTQVQRAACFWSLFSEEMLLPFSAETKEIYLQVVLESDASVPFRNVISSLYSGHWQHSFLEIYRCIEALYAIPVIEALHRELNLTIPLLDFIAKIESHSGWRPREEDALGKLYSVCDDPTVSKIQSCFPLQADQKPAGWMYNLRNSVVHFRPATQKIDLTEDQWNRVVQGTLLLVKEVYSKFKPHLASP